MVNCKESHDKTFIPFDRRTKRAVLYADRAVASGDQVFETYGNKSNAEYLRFNGFVMVDNPNDCFLVRPPKNKRTAMCLKSNEVRRFLAWAQDKETVAMYPEAAHLMPHAPARFIQTVFKRQLENYPTTIQEDEALLEDDSLSEHYRLTVEYRLEEKRAIARLLNSL
mmetsp:Transcript_73298/g.172234  ORF Transcript_73298/g.172234 Transcript_73298/m.172234 type:complete len:167 (+) Transcript_73298:40-540(+)